MKKTYIIPEVTVLQLQTHSMMALSMLTGDADPDSEVLVKEDNWEIWGSDDIED